MLARHVRPTTGPTNPEIIISDSEDTGIAIKRGNYGKDPSSDDEMLLKDGPYDFDSSPQPSTSKLPPDGIYTKRLGQKVAERGHQRDDAIEVVDDPIEGTPPRENPFGIKSGVVKKMTAVYTQQEPASQSITRREVDFNKLTRPAVSIKTNMKGKQKSQVRILFRSILLGSHFAFSL